MKFLEQVAKIPLPTAGVFMVLLWATIWVMENASWAQGVFEYLIGMKGTTP